MEKRMLSPEEICQSMIAAGERKAGLKAGKLLLLAIYAGMFIALAGMASTWASMYVENPSLKRLIAGCIFPAGLAMVVLCGSELFTGNCLMVAALLERRISLRGLLRNWGLVYLGNAIGAGLVAAAVVFGGVFSGAEETLVDLAAGKLMPASQAMLRGLLCNLLVCTAVWMAAAAKDAAGKVIALFFPIAAFVIAGLEHSVANMYYFSAGLLVAEGELSAFALLLKNLVPVTIGNIAGGGLFAAGCWHTYRKDR